MAAAARAAKKDAKTAANVILLDELKHRRRVLRRLGCALSPHASRAPDLLQLLLACLQAFELNKSDPAECLAGGSCGRASLGQRLRYWIQEVSGEATVRLLLYRYTDAEGVVTAKGRVASEIQSADELVLTELMFSGLLKVPVLLTQESSTSCSSLAPSKLLKGLLMTVCLH